MESVREALTRLLTVSKGQVLVVRSIDSARSQEDIAKILSFHSVPKQIVRGNVCLTRGDLRSALAAEAFTGFDEVWLFSETPPTEDLSAIPSATSETTDFGIGIPKELVKALERTQCLLVLGDGCGLNYATIDGRMAAAVLRLS
jgi:hypothetical protein